MANFAQRQASRNGSHSGLSSADWDVVSEGNVSQEMYSAGSLTSEESDAVIIFGGRNSRSNASSSMRDTGSALPSPTMGDSGVLNQNIQGLDLAADAEEAALALALPKPSPTTLRTEPWQQKHQRLLSAVSDLASDPGLNRVNADIYGGMEQSMPIEQRLLDQIAKLAEELDDSQEQAKLLLLQNDRLMSENDQLKRSVAEVRAAGSAHVAGSGKGDEEEPDLMRVTFAVAAGVVIIGLAKKRLLLNGVGLLGAAMLGGCVGFYRYLHKLQETKQQQPGQRT